METGATVAFQEDGSRQSEAEQSAAAENQAGQRVESEIRGVKCLLETR